MMIGFTYRDAVLTVYNAVAGCRARRVRAYRVGPVRPYAQHPQSVAVDVIEPRRRRAYRWQIVPDDVIYLTIQVGGTVVYDSRTDVPCDQARWLAAYREWRSIVSSESADAWPDPSTFSGRAS